MLTAATPNLTLQDIIYLASDIRDLERFIHRCETSAEIAGKNGEYDFQEGIELEMWDAQDDLRYLTTGEV